MERIEFVLRLCVCVRVFLLLVVWRGRATFFHVGDVCNNMLITTRLVYMGLLRMPRPRLERRARPRRDREKWKKAFCLLGLACSPSHRDINLRLAFVRVFSDRELTCVRALGRCKLDPSLKAHSFKF